jgi:hypothetical protein
MLCHLELSIPSCRASLNVFLVAGAPRCKLPCQKQGNSQDIMGSPVSPQLALLSLASVSYHQAPLVMVLVNPLVARKIR